METNYLSVPFKIDDNFSQIAGMGKFSPAGIVLEYEGKIFGIIKSGVKESRIALGEILDINFKKGVFKRGAKIEIRLKSFSKLSKTPNKDGKITLKIEHADFERAQTAVEQINKLLSEEKENLPPPRTPVSRLFDESEEETKNLNETAK